MLHSIIVLHLLVSIGFQVLFHSPPGVLFTFPSRYYFAIGHQVVFSLGWWSTLLPTGFHVSRGTLDTGLLTYISLTGLLPSMATLSNVFNYISFALRQSTTPQNRSFMVWALSLSLATTKEIVFTFSSSGYLDVSVHRVPSSKTIYSS